MASAPDHETANKEEASGNRRNGAHLDRPDKLSRDQFSISDLTTEFGCTARALRFYEEKGLLAPKRQGQDRLYSRRDRSRLRLVLMGKWVGFSLEEVKAMLDLY
ncbi:MAG: MerR family transcriptional regulator, partial [Pseudomonadota bacterium]